MSRALLLRVSAGLLWRRGRVLLLQRHRQASLFPLKWEFPGGKLESGETPEQALARELREELGIRATIGPLVAHYQHRYPDRLRVELWFFDVPSYSGRLGCHRAEQMKWVSLAELPSYELLEGDAALVKHLLARRWKTTSCSTPKK